MKVQQILTDSIFESIQDQAFQPVIGAGYLLIALNYLNIILDEWRDLIPYPSKMEFHNVDDLENSTFVQIDNVSFVINKSVTILNALSLRAFRETEDVERLLGYPDSYYFDQENQSIFIYPRPSMPNYKFVVDGRIATAVLGEFDDVPRNMPAFMRSALIYEIAFRLCGRFGKDWDSKKEDKRQSTFVSLKNKKSIDLSTTSSCDFGVPRSANSAPFPIWYYISGGRT